ncbi:MAG: hypothetical protein IPJ62_13990 [Betaproteobacteria bacterium]|nr:hypothetical protein [Betaproteobacteria bacterium]
MLALAVACRAALDRQRPPARMFMGDIGAVPLGFLAALFGLAGWGGGIWPAWFPLLVFLPFIADATATLARRGLGRERVWQAHRSAITSSCTSSAPGTAERWRSSAC